MVRVTYRGDKAEFIVGICLFAGTLTFLWALFLAVKNDAMPWWVWLMVSAISGIALFLIVLFAVMLIRLKAVVSVRSLVLVGLKKKREILKEDILLIADIPLGRGDHRYVVYPKTYDPAEVEKHLSVFIGIGERTKRIQRDQRLLVFKKTKRFTEILSEFDYASRITVINH